MGFRILKILKHIRPEIVHLEEPLATGATLGLFLFGSRRRPTVGTFHRADADSLYKGEGRILCRIGMGHRRLDERFAVSHIAARTAMEVLGGTETQYRIVPPAVAPQWFSVRKEPNDDGTFTIMYWGRIEQRKGVKHLLEAMKMDGMPPWVRLKVVGGGRNEFVEPLKKSVASDIKSGRIHSSAQSMTPGFAWKSATPTLRSRQQSTVSPSEAFLSKPWPPACLLSPASLSAGRANSPVRGERIPSAAA